MKLEDLKAFIDQLLASHLAESRHQWFEERLNRITATTDQKQSQTFFYLTFSATSRRVGQKPLELSAEQIETANSLTSASFKYESTGSALFSDWRVADLARCRLLLGLDWDQPEAAVVLENLAETGDNGELIAIYRSLQFLPEPERFVPRAREGLRTNVADVFKSLAHNNQFPAQCLPQEAWNQLVLKALFVGAPLWPIIGLDQNANEELTEMLCDYARERWAAGRAVSPELWRPVAFALTERGREDLKTALTSGPDKQRRAAAYALQCAGVNEFNEQRAVLSTADITSWQDLL